MTVYVKSMLMKSTKRQRVVDAVKLATPKHYINPINPFAIYHLSSKCFLVNILEAS